MSEHKLPPIDYTRFRLSLKRLEEQHANYHDAEVRRTALVEEAVAESVIRRFKVCYDCLWKVLRRYLIERVGLADVPNGPKQVFRLADQSSLLQSSLAQWMLYADRRVDAMHDYDGGKVNACLESVADFIHDAGDLYETMNGETWA